MEEIIQEIAEAIDMGDIVYVHRENYTVLSYPDPRQEGASEFDYLMREVLDVVDLDPDSYIRIEPLNSNESYQIMAGFAETVNQESKKAAILIALEAKRPFRGFRMAIEDAGLEDDWYEFKDAYLRVHVRDLL